MPAIVTISNSIESDKDIKIVRSSMSEDSYTLKPNNAEQFEAVPGETFSIEQIEEEADGPSEEEQRDAAVEAGEKQSDEA